MKEFNGKPPVGAFTWSKEAFAKAVTKLDSTITEEDTKGTEGAMTRNKFIQDVINVGKSPFKTISGVLKMFNRIQGKYMLENK